MKNTDSHTQILQPTFGETFTFVGELDSVDLVKLAASTLSDNDALPLGHHQLGPVVRVDVKNVHALVMRRSTARSLDSPPLPHVDERLEETVVVQGKESRRTAAAAHVGVEPPRLQDEVETLELSQVDNHVVFAATLAFS